MIRISKKELMEKLGLKSIYTCYDKKLTESFVLESKHYALFNTLEKDKHFILNTHLRNDNYEPVVFSSLHGIKGKRVFGFNDIMNKFEVESYSSLKSLLEIAEISSDSLRVRLEIYNENKTAKDYEILKKLGHRLIPEDLYISLKNIQTKEELFFMAQDSILYSATKNDDIKESKCLLTDIVITPKVIDSKYTMTLRFDYKFENNTFTSDSLKLKKKAKKYNFSINDKYFNSIDYLSSEKIKQLKESVKKWEKNSSSLKKIKVRF